MKNRIEKSLLVLMVAVACLSTGCATGRHMAFRPATLRPAMTPPRIDAVAASNDQTRPILYQAAVKSPARRAFCGSGSS